MARFLRGGLDGGVIGVGGCGIPNEEDTRGGGVFVWHLDFIFLPA